MKKIALIIIIAISSGVIGVLGFYFFYFHPLKTDVMEDRALTLQLSPMLLKQLGGKEIYDFPHNPAPVQWNGKYLQVDYGRIFEEIDTPLNFVYNRKRNEKLNTARFFPGDDINGIVWLTLNSNIVGTYSGGGVAAQPYYIIYYLDLAQEAIFAQDTIWGGMPPATISGATMGAVGKYPKEEEVIKAIKQRTEN